jgi:hypothetical protein
VCGPKPGCFTVCTSGNGTCFFERVDGWMEFKLVRGAGVFLQVFSFFLVYNLIVRLIPVCVCLYGRTVGCNVMVNSCALLLEQRMV